MKLFDPKRLEKKKQRSDDDSDVGHRFGLRFAICTFACFLMMVLVFSNKFTSNICNCCLMQE